MTADKMLDELRIIEGPDHREYYLYHDLLYLREVADTLLMMLTTPNPYMNDIEREAEDRKMLQKVKHWPKYLRKNK